MFLGLKIQEESVLTLSQHCSLGNRMLMLGLGHWNQFKIHFGFSLTCDQMNVNYGCLGGEVKFMLL